MGGPIAQTWRGRVLVAGDAGGFVNAYTAEGIYYAMVSGELAGRAILEDAAFDDPRGGTTAGARYECGWRGEIGAELRDSVLIQKYLFRDAARIDVVVGRCVAAPRGRRPDRRLRDGHAAVPRGAAPAVGAVPRGGLAPGPRRVVGLKQRRWGRGGFLDHNSRIRSRNPGIRSDPSYKESDT